MKTRNYRKRLELLFKTNHICLKQTFKSAISQDSEAFIK